MVYSGKPTREWLTREDSASPTAALESIMLTAVIDAHEGRDVMCADIPNAFIQAEMPDISDGEERVTMKITGVLVDMLVQLSPEIYGPYVVFEKQRKVIYVQVLKAIYGMLQAALLWYNKFRQELEKEGFEFNPYDPCVGNRTKNGSQHTIRFHVDDVMSSHINPKVNDDFDKWLQAKYGEHGKVKAHRGKVHDYLGMIFEYKDKGKVEVDMSSYVKNMREDFPVKLKKSQTAATPTGEGLYNLGQGRKLNKEDAEAFHTMVADERTICMQTSKTRHSAYDRVVMHANKRTERVRLEQTHQDDEVPEWYARHEAYFERRKHTEYKMVCGCVVRSTPRLQKSDRRNNDIRKRSGTIAIKEAEAQYKEQHRSRTSGSRRRHYPDTLDQAFHGSTRIHDRR